MNLEQIDPIEAGNPYLQYHKDNWRMGRHLDNNVMVMFEKHENNGYFIVVDTRTGERARLTL